MLKTVILQQKEERDMFLKRNYQKRISIQEKADFLASGLIKLITGPRSIQVIPLWKWLLGGDAA